MSLVLLAVAPILLTGILLLGFKLPARIAMPLVFLLTALIAWAWWGIEIPDIVASSIKGLFVTVDML